MKSESKEHKADFTYAVSDERATTVLEELSKRLPYGLYCKIRGENRKKRICGISVDEKSVSFYYPFPNGQTDRYGNKGEIMIFNINEWLIYPCLRSESNLTEEEARILESHRRQIANSTGNLFTQSVEAYNRFVYSHHIDTNGLIAKGYAVEAAQNTYKIKALL